MLLTGASNKPSAPNDRRVALYPGFTIKLQISAHPVTPPRHAELSLFRCSQYTKSVLSWTYGFSDAQKALYQKIVSINRCSRGSGWMATSRQYWPIVAETYTWLLALVEGCTTSCERLWGIKNHGQGNFALNNVGNQTQILIRSIKD